jgi:hypothetical protein
MKVLLLSCFVLGSVIWGVSADKPRVYITDSKSWEIGGGVGGTSDGFGGAAKGGDRPQTAEIIKTFNERCPSVIVNNRKEKADYVVLLDHEGGKDSISRDNKVVVFNKDGDAIMSHSTRMLGNAVKDACVVIAGDWPKQSIKAANASKSDAPAEDVAARNK